MSKDIFVRKKGVIRWEHRFLGNISSSVEEDDDDGRRTNFCLERFHDCSFFNQEQYSTTTTVDHNLVDDDVDDDDDAAGEIQRQGTAEERKMYWESQKFLLQEILEQYDLIGSKLRDQIKRQIDMARQSNFCNCQRDCIMCLRRASVNQLCSKGLNAAVCISQWKRTYKTPAGSHEYIEVMANTQGKRKQIPFLVELGFRDEFRMAKACDEYNKLINQLPEIYIGKSEHMNAIIRLMCEAAKKSAEEQKIHMGPWRKRSFMQMKWSASSPRKFLRHSSNDQVWISSSSTQQRVIGAASSFELPMATILKVA